MRPDYRLPTTDYFVDSGEQENEGAVKRAPTTDHRLLFPKEKSHEKSWLLFLGKSQGESVGLIARLIQAAGYVFVALA